jgi:N-acetylmuramoyl-L-alanine amidase
MSMDGCISERCLNEKGRWQFSVVAVLVLALASIASAAPQAVEKVTDIRFWTAGDTTRVAIEVSGEFTYRAERLSAPDRVFFDLTNTKIALKAGKSSTIPVKDGLVKQVRLAEKQPGTIRVVLDLEDGIDYSVSQLSNPERLMVELRPKKAKGAAPKSEAPQPKPETTSAPPPRTVPETTPTPKAAAPTALVAPEPKAEPKRDTQLAFLIPPVFASIAGTSPGQTISASILPGRPMGIPEPLPTLPPAPIKEKELKEKEPAVGPIPAEPKPAARNANGERSLTRVLGLKLGRVVLDAGHGGHDRGTSSKAGMLEKDLVLDITTRLAELLRTRLGTEVIMTRSDDTYLSLEERTRLANESKADLFLSIHANSSPVKSVAGVETFYLNFSTGRDDLDLATRENAASQRSISDLKEVVTKIALRAKVDESREFAMRIQNSLQTTAVKQNKEAKDRGVKRAPFVVLIGADMPSVLAEIGFLSNSRDEALLKGPEHRDRIAEALFNGIAGYADSLSKTTQIAHAGR